MNIKILIFWVGEVAIVRNAVSITPHILIMIYRGIQIFTLAVNSKLNAKELSDE